MPGRPLHPPAGPRWVHTISPCKYRRLHGRPGWTRMPRKTSAAQARLDEEGAEALPG